MADVTQAEIDHRSCSRGRAMTEQSHGTGIEWTHVPGYKGETWNPVRGCEKFSPGCKHCYAETFAKRWRGIPGHPYERGFDLRLVPEKLSEPLHHKNPRAYFVNSMSDLHQEGVPHNFLRAAYSVMGACRRHIFMVLTKRAEGMRVDLGALRMDRGPFESYEDLSGPFIQENMRSFAEAPLPNVWLGVSVEDRKYGLPRVDILRTIPATVRFLSIEPLLEDLGPLDLSGIHWVIIGGVVPFRQYTRRGESYRVLVESIVPDGKVRWIRFRRVDGASRSEWLGYWMFVRRYKEAA